MMTLEELKARIAQLTEQEKKAWAELNYLCGARAELERLVAAEESQEEPCASPQPALSS